MVFDSGVDLLVNVNWTMPRTKGRSTTPHRFHSPDPPTRVGRGRLAADTTPGIPQASFQVVDDADACSSSGSPGQLLIPYLYHARGKKEKTKRKFNRQYTRSNRL
jgi:hypothetical protein